MNVPNPEMSSCPQLSCEDLSPDELIKFTNRVIDDFSSADHQMRDKLLAKLISTCDLQADTANGLGDIYTFMDYVIAKASISLIVDCRINGITDLDN